MAEVYVPGDIAVSHSPGVLGKLIRVGEFIHGDGAASHWNHAFVIVSEDGDTIEAGSRGVVKNHIRSHPERMILGCPRDVDRDKVVAEAIRNLGVEYGYWEDVLLGVDCLTHWKLHEKAGKLQKRPDSMICSQLAAICLIAGGWTSPQIPALTMPSSLVISAKAWA